jgi:hypothetical protein
MTYGRAIAVLLVCTILFLGTASGVLAQGPDGDQFIVGQDVVLRSGDEITGSLAVVGGDIRLEPESVVDGDVALMGGDLRVGGTVTGDVVVFGGSIRLDESAVIEGSLAAIGSSIERAPGARVNGEVFDSKPFSVPRGLAPPDLPPLAPLRPEPAEPSLPWSILLWPLQALGWSLFMAFFAALAVLIAPRNMGRIANAVAAQPLMSFAVGLVTLAVSALAGLVLLICCCLGLIVWLGAAFAAFLGWIAVGLWVGQALLNALRMRDASSYLEAAVGVFVITFASRLPFCIGWIIGTPIAALGLGAVVLTRFGTRSYPVGSMGDDAAGLLTEHEVDDDLLT